MNRDYSRGAQVFVLLGRTGSGKSTIGKEVYKKLGLQLISIGELARVEIANKTRRGKYFEALFNDGKQVPDEMVIEMIEQKLISSPNKFKRGFILDNFPNSMKQVNLFNEFIRKHHLQINTVFHTCVSREVSFKRRNAEKRGYWDSSEKRERLFQANLVPVLLHFKKKKLLR